MSTDEQNEAYSRTQEAYDAYQSLTDEQKAEMSGAETVFGTLFDYFNGLAALASVGEGFIDANGLKYMITSDTGVTLIQNSEVYQALTKITIPETVTNRVVSRSFC